MSTQPPAKDEREAARLRLEAALRENLKRRKAQRRARATDAPSTDTSEDETP